MTRIDLDYVIEYLADLYLLLAQEARSNEATDKAIDQLIAEIKDIKETEKRNRR